jgi:predicted GIY-YIG superfamily endonuclease
MIGYIYVIRNKDLNDTSLNYYIGSTKDLKNREKSHKSTCKKSNLKVYQYIRDNGGWKNFIMYPIYEMEYKDELELRQYEQKYIDQYKPNLNGQNAIKDMDAYYNNRNTQHACDCGGKFTKSNQSSHFKTAKHLRYVLTLSAKSNAATVEAMEALSIE